MRWPLVLLAPAVVLVAGCGSGANRPPPKRPNNELIVGQFERHPPDGTTVARFQGNGTITVAHDRASLDRKNLAVGTYQLDGDTLTLDYSTGEMCKGGVIGTYRVVVSKLGIRFTKVDDACERRAQIDGQTWFRVK